MQMTLSYWLRKKGCEREWVIEIGKCYRMEMNVGKLKVKRISRQQSPTQIIMYQK